MFRTATTAAFAALILCATSAHAIDPAPKCEASKLGTTAKYASCRLKANAKAVKTGDPVDYSKCNLDKFASAETTAGMGMCRTEFDQDMVTGYLDDCTTRVAIWLASDGGLPDTCDSDLATCEGDLTTCDADLAACEAASSAQPLKTGQTTCYNTAGTAIACGGSGQDAEFLKGANQSYTDDPVGTITDNSTGMMWEKLVDDGGIHDKDTEYTWATAFGVKVASLNAAVFAGYSDWRVPNLKELQTLQNFGQVAPAIHPAFKSPCAPGCSLLTCSCTGLYYWSSTSQQAVPMGAWIVDFDGGNTMGSNKADTRGVRAVRGGS